MSATDARYPCPCCGYRTLPLPPPGSWELCPVCYWQDQPPAAPHAVDDHEDLLLAQDTFETIGAAYPNSLSHVRPPISGEAREPGWRTLRSQSLEERPEVLERIRTAFDGVLLGRGISLADAELLDDYVGLPPNRPAARPVPWREVPLPELERFQLFPFLDAEGMRYYLPAFMVWTVETFEENQSIAQDFLLYNLERGPSMAPFDLLSAPQREAVVVFLRYMVRYGARHCDARAGRRALNRWSAA